MSSIAWSEPQLRCWRSCISFHGRWPIVDRTMPVGLITNVVPGISVNNSRVSWEEAPGKESTMTSPPVPIVLVVEDEIGPAHARGRHR